MAEIGRGVIAPEARENPRSVLLRISDGYPVLGDEPPDHVAWHLRSKCPRNIWLKYFLVDLVAGFALAYPYWSPSVYYTDRPTWFLVLLLLGILQSVTKNAERAARFPQSVRYFLWACAFTYVRSAIALQYYLPLLLIPFESGILKGISNASDELRTISDIDLSRGHFQRWTLAKYRFQKVNFALADLTGATFEGVLFQECNLEEVIANGATFRNCTFFKCRLDLGQLRGTTWVSTKVEQSSLTYADLREAEFDRRSTILKSDCDEASFSGGNAGSRVKESRKTLGLNA